MSSSKPVIRILAIATALALTRCTSSPRFTSKSPQQPVPGGSKGGGAAANSSTIPLLQEGNASYYGEEFNGRSTASGEKYNMDDLTAAHRTYPFGTRIKVTLKSTGKSVVVRINDRGPWKDDRIIDLSLAAAKAIGLIAKGTGVV